MFSFTYLKQDVTICLRCQIRLAIRSKLSQKRQILRTPQSIRYLSSTSIRYTANDFHEHPFPRAFLPEFGRSHKSDQLVFHPASPRFRFRRLQLGQQVVSLGLDALGEPAQIRIVREREDQHRRKVLVAESDENVSSQVKSREDILDAINADKEGQDADPFDNLEALRKNFLYDSGIVDLPTASQCHEIAQGIHDGFTIPQLERYLQRTKSSQAVDLKELERRYEDEFFTRSAWYIGVSGFPHHAIQRLESNELASAVEQLILGLEPLSGQKQSKKQKLVEDVLRKSWRLRLKEEKVVEGEIDIRLRPQYLALLLNHRTDIFGRISEQLGTKIDISQSRCVVRITGDYNTCSEAFGMIHLMLRDIRTEVLDLQHLGEAQRSALNASSLMALDASKDKILIERLEKLTGTHLEPVQSSTDDNQITKLRVYHMGPDQTDFEDVQRLVIQVLIPEGRKKSHFQYEETAISASLVRVPVEVGTTLPWTERVTRWTRWTVGTIVKPTAVEEEDVARRPSVVVLDPVKKQDIMEQIARFLFEDRILEVGREFEEVEMHDGNGYWNPRVRQVVNATPGHIAYPAPARLLRTKESGSIPKVDRRKQLWQTFYKTMHNRRILVTNLAENFSTLRYFASQQDPVLRDELYVLLKPNKVKDIGQVDMSAFPDLRLRIAIESKSRSIELNEVRLIVDERESDLLLLNEVADIRFKAYSFISGSSNIDPEIQQFVADSNLDVWGTARLKTPSKLQISIPGFAIKSPTAEESTTLGSLSKTNVAVEYTFSRLEYHSHLSVLYQGLNTSYSTIEGGKTGGRRHEICLESPNMEIGADVESATNAFSPFFNSVREYVTRMTMSPVEKERDLDKEDEGSDVAKPSAPGVV